MTSSSRFTPRTTFPILNPTKTLLGLAQGLADNISRATSLSIHSATVNADPAKVDKDTELSEISTYVTAAAIALLMFEEKVFPMLVPTMALLIFEEKLFPILVPTTEDERVNISARTYDYLERTAVVVISSLSSGIRHLHQFNAYTDPRAPALKKACCIHLTAWFKKQFAAAQVALSDIKSRPEFNEVPATGNSLARRFEDLIAFILENCEHIQDVPPVVTTLFGRLEGVCAPIGLIFLLLTIWNLGSPYGDLFLNWIYVLFFKKPGGENNLLDAWEKWMAHPGVIIHIPKIIAEAEVNLESRMYKTWFPPKVCIVGLVMLVSAGIADHPLYGGAQPFWRVHSKFAQDLFSAVTREASRDALWYQEQKRWIPVAAEKLDGVRNSFLPSLLGSASWLTL
ncbi:hypothetical protein FPV67DRAFT_1454472 [Lyophyllum atratum]|nr:hypothetical protein FPV67DRAFT_1454469 [Lyophyllum atratum]KAF8059291.1 hypothetical protein FPV67DRAFT_1454472 [Lyophyllum atratum]